MTNINMDKKKEEYMQIVRNNWHYGAGEIIDMDKFIDETLSWISTNFVPKEEVEKERNTTMQIIKGFKVDTKKNLVADHLIYYSHAIHDFNTAIDRILKELQDK